MKSFVISDLFAKRLKRFYCHALILILAMSAVPSSVSAAFTAIYASDGNDGYTFTGCFTVANLKASCWNGIIMFAASVQPNGDITAGGNTLVSNGVYMGDANWGSNVTNLKTPPTSVTRYELCVGGWGDTSYANIQNIINSQGAYGILYTNFRALKNACPGLDAINDDDEGNYDLNSSIQFGQMLYNSCGLKFTQVPYQNQSFWVSLKNSLGAACDLVYLQCYQGGAGNNPAQWDSAYGGGFHVIPGEETNYASQSQFATWASTGSTGGFFWPDWYYCPGTNWPTLIAQGIGTSCSLPAVNPYLQVNGGAWQNTNNATVPFGALVNLGPQDSGEAWSWTGPGGYTSTSREIDSIPLSVGVNTFTVTNTTQCVCNQSNTFTITMQPPAACANGNATFGNTAAGTGCCNQGGQLDCCSYNLTQPMTVTYMQIYMGSGTNGNGVLGIYADNGGSPGTLLTKSNAMQLTSGWNTFAVNPVYLAPGNYWLSASLDSKTNNFWYSNSGGGGLLFKTYAYNGNLPSTPGGGMTGYGWLMSINANGCVVLPTATPTWTVPACTTSSTTLGNASSANAGSAGAGGIIGGTTYTLSQPMTVTSLSFYFSGGTNGSGVVGLYSDSGGRPGTLLVQSNAQSLNSGGWNNFVVTPTAIQPGNYWIYGSFSGTANWQYSNGCCTGGYLFGSYTYNGSLPNTITTTLTGYGWTMCAYASGCLQPTATMTNTPRMTSTSTVTNSPTQTSTVTNTPTVTDSPTQTNTATNSATHTVTNTATNTATHTSTNTATSTATNSSTSTATNTATKTNSQTATNTRTASSTPTETDTATSSATHTASNTATVTHTQTQTSTASSSPTETHSATMTSTPTATSTLTSTNTPKATSTHTATCTVTITNTPSVTKPVIYPNPVAGPTVTLQLPGNNLTNVSVEIFTLSFREIKTVTMPQVVGSSLVIDLTDRFSKQLANGLYYFRITVGNKKWVEKLLVLR